MDEAVFAHYVAESVRLDRAQRELDAFIARDGLVRFRRSSVPYQLSEREMYQCADDAAERKRVDRAILDALLHGTGVSVTPKPEDGLTVEKLRAAKRKLTELCPSGDYFCSGCWYSMTVKHDRCPRCLRQLVDIDVILAEFKEERTWKGRLTGWAKRFLRRLKSLLP